jgi:hypothetical protein
MFQTALCEFVAACAVATEAVAEGLGSSTNIDAKVLRGLEGSSCQLVDMVALTLSLQ